MALENKYKITVNTKKQMFRDIPEIVANDNAVFEVEVYDDTVLFPLSANYTYKLVSKKISGKSVIRDGVLSGNVIKFTLGSSEALEPGKVEGTVQIFDSAMKRISTAKFDYVVRRDPSTSGGLPTDDKTLVIANESLMLDSISKSNKASTDSASALTKATAAETKSTSAVSTANNVQAQLDNIVMKGDSSPAATQAAVDAKGVAKASLKKRLDDDYNEVTTALAESAKKTEGTKSLKEFGAKGNANYYDSTTKKYYEDAAYTIEATNDTKAIKDAIAYSKSKGVEITVPIGNFLFTEQINFDGKVSFVGQGSNYSAKFLKHHAGHGFFITKDRCELLNVSVFASEGFRGLNTGTGVIIGDDEAVENVRANWCKIDIFSMYHGEHGIDCRKGNECIIRGNYDQNRTDGVHCSSEWAGGAADWNANIMEFSAMGNGRHGLYIYRSETNMIRVVVQGNGWRDNTGVGAYINWSGNSGFIYSEGNVNGQVTYGASGYGNNISMHTVNQNPSFQNHKNVGYVNVTGTGLTGFYKYFYAQIQNAVTFNISSSGTIPANNFVDFSTNTAYGITSSNCLLQISPSVGLPQGLTFEVFYASTATIKIRIHNITNADIVIGSTIVWRGKAELLL